MMFETSSPARTLLFKGGPTLIDLLIDTTEIRITITGPRMLFERLQLLTTLSAFEGCTVQRLRALADCLEGTIHCGLIGIQNAVIEVETLRSGGILQVDLGPPSMYQSELVLRTRTGETFRTLIQRMICDDPVRSFFAGLHPVTAAGHLEHHHGSGGENGGTHGHGGHHEGVDHGHS